MRKLHSLLLASVVLAASAVSTVSQVGAAPLPAATTVVSSENADDTISVTAQDETITTVAVADLDGTAIAATEDVQSPTSYPAVNRYQYSDDNS